MLNDAQSIQRLTGLEAVRRRPGMYVGGTDSKAMHHLLFEVVDHALMHALNGRCDRIDITLCDDNVVCIQDNGPGIPVVPSGDTDRLLPEILLTELHTGGMLRNAFDLNPYEVSGGLRGLGLAPINALSEWLHLETTYDGFVWRQDYRTGLIQNRIERVRASDGQCGTAITFKPDFTILAPSDFSYDYITKRCLEVAYQLANLTLHLRDEREMPPRETTFHEPDGLRALVMELARSAEPVTPVISAGAIIPPRPDDGWRGRFPIRFEFAFLFTKQASSVKASFSSTVPTTYGGTHVKGLRQGIVRYLNRVRRGSAIRPARWNDIAPHMVTAVSVILPDPQFESQTRVKLLNPEVVAPIAKAACDAFAAFAADHTNQMEDILCICRAVAGWQ